MESNKEWKTETLSAARQGVPGARSRHGGLRETWQVAEETVLVPHQSTPQYEHTGDVENHEEAEEHYASSSLASRNTRRRDRFAGTKWSLEMNIEVTRTY